MLKYVLLAFVIQQSPATVMVGQEKITFLDPKRSTVEIRRYEHPADCNSALISLLNAGRDGECRELDDNGNLKPRRVSGDVLVVNTRREPDVWIRVEQR